MTRRGTLAYYLAAWVVGCFITAALFTSTAESVRVSMFLVTYFFALMGGLAGLLLFAFFLQESGMYCKRLFFIELSKFGDPARCCQSAR